MNEYDVLPGESFDEYCHRISNLRNSLNLTWKEITDIINYTYGCKYSDWYYRNKEKKYLQNTLEDADQSLISEDLLNLAKLRVQLSDERSQINAMIRRMSREDTLKEIALEVVKNISKEKQLVFKSSNYQESLNKEALLLISDWHYGNEINNIYNVYNPEIAKKRIYQLYELTVQKCLFNNIKHLHIANLGDMISGNIHLPLRINSRIDVITQVIEVSELICEFICDLSKHFSITYYSTSDNHSRIESNKKESIDLESLYRITDWYIKNRIPNINYVENKFGQSIATMNILGYSIACVHGDKDKPDTLIDKLSNFTESSYSLICTAHEHHFSANEKHGTLMICNGSLMGTDDYAFNLRLHSKPSQNLIIISKNNVLDTLYRLELY